MMETFAALAATGLAVLLVTTVFVLFPLVPVYFLWLAIA